MEGAPPLPSTGAASAPVPHVNQIGRWDADMPFHDRNDPWGDYGVALERLPTHILDKIVQDHLSGQSAARFSRSGRMARDLQSVKDSRKQSLTNARRLQAAIMRRQRHPHIWYEKFRSYANPPYPGNFPNNYEDARKFLLNQVVRSRMSWHGKHQAIAGGAWFHAGESPIIQEDDMDDVLEGHTQSHLDRYTIRDRLRRPLAYERPNMIYKPDGTLTAHGLQLQHQAQQAFAAWRQQHQQ